MPVQLLFVLAMGVYSVVLAATYFTRATTRRFLGAVAGGVVVAVAGVGISCDGLGPGAILLRVSAMARSPCTR